LFITVDIYHKSNRGRIGWYGQWWNYRMYYTGWRSAYFTEVTSKNWNE